MSIPKLRLWCKYLVHVDCVYGYLYIVAAYEYETCFQIVVIICIEVIVFKYVTYNLVADCGRQITQIGPYMITR